MTVVKQEQQVNMLNTFATAANTLIQNGVVNEYQVANELRESGLFANISADDIEEMKMLMNLPEILKNQKARARKFKPVKMSKRTELWYRQQLKQFVKMMTNDVERALQQPQGSFFYG